MITSKSTAGKLTVAGLIEARAGVAVGGEDGHPVTASLQSDGGVDDEAFGPADAQVGMEEDDVLFFLVGGHCGVCERFYRTGV